MKKILLSALFISTAAAAAANAAETSAYIPYIGVDYSYIDAKANAVKPHYNSMGFNIGTKYNDYFGTEVFYQQTSSDSKKIKADEKLKTSYRAYGLDIATYLPLGCYHQFDLLATAGIGEYVFKKKLTGGKHHNDSGWGYRIGAGAMYNIDENISLRILARYVGIDKVSDFKHLAEYSAGIRYNF